MTYADPADEATAISEAFLERSIQAARGVIPPSVDPSKASADECMDCGNLISSERQIAVPGCQLCMDCAEDLERRARMAGL